MSKGKKVIICSARVASVECHLCVSDRCCNEMISPLVASSSVWGCYSDCGLSVGEARVEYEGAEYEERGRNRK